jgi:hypothetical protein
MKGGGTKGLTSTWMTSGFKPASRRVSTKQQSQLSTSTWHGFFLVTLVCCNLNHAKLGRFE